MAIAVVRASSQYAEATSSCLGAGSLTTFTLAGWYKPSSIANGTVIGIGRSSTAPYIAMGMDGSGNVFIEVSDGSGVNVTGGTLSNGVWAHIGGVQASATSRAAYLNGAAGTTNTTSKTPSGLDRTTLGGLVLNGTRLSFAGGDIGECGAWSVALTTAEMLMLAAGMSPLCVRPQSLVFYAPLTQASSPEQDLRGALALTFGAAGAAPTKATSHPRVFKPVQHATILVPTAGGTDATVTAPAATGLGSSPVPVVTAGSTVTTPAALALGSAPVAAVTAGSVVISPAALALGSFPVAAVVAASVVTSPAATALGSAPAPVLVNAVEALPGVATGTLPAPILTNAVQATPATGLGFLSVPAVTTGSTITSPAGTALGSVPVPAVSTGNVIETPPATCTGTFPAPGVSGSGSAIVSALPGVATGATVAPTATADGLVTSVPATTTGAAVVPVLSAASVLQVVPAIALGLSPTSSVSAGAEVASTTAIGTAIGTAPTITATATLGATPMLVLGSMPVPTISATGIGSADVQVAPAVALGAFRAPAVGIPAVGWLEPGLTLSSLLEGASSVTIYESGLALSGVIE